MCLKSAMRFMNFSSDQFFSQFFFKLFSVQNEKRVAIVVAHIEEKADSTVTSCYLSLF